MNFNSRAASFTAAAILLLGGASANSFAAKNNERDDDDPYKNIHTFISTMRLLRDNYVDKDKVTYQKLFEGAMRGMVGSLDSYSFYQDSDSYDRTLQRFDGSFVGIGVVLRRMDNGLLRVEATLPDSPARNAGLAPGDFIESIDDQNVPSMSIEQAIEKIKGQPGSDVRVRFYSHEKKLSSNITITREHIKNHPIPENGVQFPAPGIGYIRVNQFSALLDEDFDRAYAKLARQNLNAIIIDLRNNPGGLLDLAVRLCSRFLPPESLVVSTSGRKKDEDTKFLTDPRPRQIPDIPVALLIDRTSASASEIVAACLKDHRRAIIIGEKSFGKGSIQKIQRLHDKSGIKYTVAKYLSPSGKIIDGIGVEPDIKVEIRNDLRPRLLNQLIHSPGIINPPLPGSIPDQQLQRAVEILTAIHLLSERQQ